eukprot:scaffold356_cov135-Isochrysis_galbana.AAC.3
MWHVGGDLGRTFCCNRPTTDYRYRLRVPEHCCAYASSLSCGTRPHATHYGSLLTFAHAHVTPPPDEGPGMTWSA